MSYVLNQLNQSKITLADLSSTESYMVDQTSGTPKRRQNTSAESYYDECVCLGSSLVAGNTYYLHARIQRLAYTQKFYIYLVNYSTTDTTSPQFVQTLEVKSGETTDWADVEMMLTPLTSYDCILFQLQRDSSYEANPYYPRIIYQELSLMENIITSKIGSGISLTKIGVQAPAGLMLCINNEEIHVGKSGIYEVRNGIVSVDFFSVAVPSEIDFSVTTSMTASGEITCMEDFLAKMSANETITSSSNTNSGCLFWTPKLRSMESFVLDYMYNKEA